MTIDRETFAWLCSPTGQTLLAELAARDITEADVLRELTRLRSRYPPEQARAAVEQTLLRRRARTKFAHAEQLYFTREALEQATSAPVARHRASRFAGYHHIADMCCGIGGDALALAAVGHQVTAVDHDELRLAIAAANAQSLGLSERIRFVAGDVLATPLPSADALFCDPGRRSGGRRRFRLEQYEPPLSRVLEWSAHYAVLAVKLAPGVDSTELLAVLHRTVPGTSYECEYVSLDGELKEAVLWCGARGTVRRRATVLRSTGEQVEDATHAALTDEAACSTPPLAPPQAILYEPDPAVIRSGLVAHLATQLGAAQLDQDIAYLTAPEQKTTPFARAWRVLEWLPFNLKRLRSRLRDLQAGVVTVKKRGSPLDTDALARQLAGTGPRSLVIVLTHMQGKPVVLICDQQAEAPEWNNHTNHEIKPRS